jgi:predicted nucleotidyltransferase
MTSVVASIYPNLPAPPWLPNAICYEVLMGSNAYGVSSDTSDLDIYGFCIPKKETIFPHLAGEILGFGTPFTRFEVWQEHHVKHKEKEYDFSIYGIVKYFQLCMENNPNMIDTLFVPTNCVLYSNLVGQKVRENRYLFLHKGSFYKFKGYAYSQLNKMRLKNPKSGSKRAADIEKNGYDVKFAYHLVRLTLEIEQILSTGDLDLQLHREQLKSIRRGEVPMEEIEKFFHAKEKDLESLYHSSTAIPYKPNEDAIKQLLLDCLEMHYGSLEKAIVIEDKAVRALKDIQEILNKVSI